MMAWRKCVEWLNLFSLIKFDFLFTKRLNRPTLSQSCSEVHPIPRIAIGIGTNEIGLFHHIQNQVFSRDMGCDLSFNP